MGEQSLPEFDIYTVCRMGQKIGAHQLQDDVEQSYEDEPRRQNIESGVAPMIEDFVDHRLKEQRSDQAEDLNEKRSEQYMKEMLTIAPDRRQEPVQPEGPLGLDRRTPPTFTRNRIASTGPSSSSPLKKSRRFF